MGTRKKARGYEKFVSSEGGRKVCGKIRHYSIVTMVPDNSYQETRGQHQRATVHGTPNTWAGGHSHGDLYPVPLGDIHAAMFPKQRNRGHGRWIAT